MSVERVGTGVVPAPPAIPAPLRLPLGVAALLSTLVLLAVGVRYAGQAAPSGFDAAARSVAAASSTSSRTVALMVDFGGEPVGAAVLVALLTALCLALRRGRLAVLTVACLVPAAATTALKPVFDRTINGGFLSYPSGHTALATALALVFGLLAVDLFRAGRAASVLVVLGFAVLAGLEMAWAQVALNAHYATDTIGGFCTAVALVPLLGLLIDRVADRRGS
ncbi:phosphatase PAP2 family protein [Qaidamihabitans albus]|uniref:phosphatase PAP2 family protein n=1 Tax=Qaidamihabitans albus TaxID=2795733 RepID=UPI0027DD74EC|nr:phosphatase PAP2 family protein [Qaidamihabitans albus]